MLSLRNPLSSGYCDESESEGEGEGRDGHDGEGEGEGEGESPQILQSPTPQHPPSPPISSP